MKTPKSPSLQTLSRPRAVGRWSPRDTKALPKELPNECASQARFAHARPSNLRCAVQTQVDARQWCACQQLTVHEIREHDCWVVLVRVVLRRQQAHQCVLRRLPGLWTCSCFGHEELNPGNPYLPPALPAAVECSAWCQALVLEWFGSRLLREHLGCNI